MRRARLLHLIRRSLKLSAAERRQFLRAYVQLARFDLLLRLRGFRRLVAQCESRRANSSATVSHDDLRRAQEYARWLETAARFHPVTARCLHRSLALHHWLRSEGFASALQIGVRKDGGELKAHAWVELGGGVVNEPRSAVAAFTPLARSGPRCSADVSDAATSVPQVAADIRMGTVQWQ